MTAEAWVWEDQGATVPALDRLHSEKNINVKSCLGHILGFCPSRMNIILTHVRAESFKTW